MGQTVVFTVSLDTDDVAIESAEPRDPHRPFRDAAWAALRDRRWYLAALAAFALPAVAAAATAAITGGAWATTCYLVVAVMVTPVSAGWAASRAPAGTWDAKVAHLLVAGLGGAALALVAVPALLVAGRFEDWDGQVLGPTLGLLALVGAAGAWLGVTFAARGSRRPALATGALVAVVTLAPLAAFAALLPSTETADTVDTYVFTTTYDLGRPAYVCGTETTEVTRRHTETIAWIALGSPAVWIIDAAILTPGELAGADAGTLAQAQAWTRSTRVGPDSFAGYCYAPTSLGVPAAVRERRYEIAPPVGAQMAFGAAFCAAAVALVAVSRRRSA